MLDFVYMSSYNVDDFRNIMNILRSKDGCPWDREQTHTSIRRNLLEEAYEVCEAIDNEDAEHLKEELGDLLMQIIFHAQMEEEIGSFNLDDVADRACQKLILRHPHVFSDVKVDNADEVLKNWDDIKRQEKAQETVSSAMDGVAKSLPALWRAEKIQKKAQKVGFDWPDISGALSKLDEELNEFHQAVKINKGVEEELGDILFAAVNAARFAGVDPEDALHKSCDKFTRRFRFIEKEAKLKGVDLDTMSLDEMETLYQQAKSREA